MTSGHTVVIDLSVVMHKMHEAWLGSNIPKEHYKSWLKAQIVWMTSLEWMGSMKGDNVILVCDTKVQGKYWRTDYLATEEVTQATYERALASYEAFKVEHPRSRKKPPVAKPIHYKGGRNLPDHFFTKLKQDVYSYCGDLGVHIIRESGYEADDLAAAIVQIADCKLTLVTVDTDWLAMCDLEQVTWFCAHGWYPRVRFTLEEVNTWAEKRLKTTFNHPRELWEYKAIHGDVSDNLPPGSPIEVIDLFQPPQEHKLWERPGLASIIQVFLDNPYIPFDEVKATAAINWLRRVGSKTCIRTLDVESDLHIPSAGL